ncbi:hypothetical protein Vretifemale_20344 [Volvox reticuliferus]|nr:hypothetical protein Vretifemale_20344 [Volvox reticuliferus]
MAATPTAAAEMRMAPTVLAVIFDMDGLLLDTEKAYTIAQQHILDRFGRTFTWELKAQMMGRQALEAAKVLLDALQLSPAEITPEQFLSERDALLHDIFPESPLLPGAERLVRHLAAHRIPIAVATGSNQSQFALKTSKHRDLFALFDNVVTGDMVHRAKPDPAIFLRAVEGLPPPIPAPASVLVFEDAPNGVQAALAAGMQVVMVPDGGLPVELQRCGATALLGSLEDFKPEEWGLPPYA